MKTPSILAHAVAGIAMCSFALAPLTAFAQGRGHGNGHGNGNGRGNENRGRDEDWDQGRGGNWNPAPPKKNGRHDNRNWNKRNRSYDDYRYQDYRYQQYGMPRYNTNGTRIYRYAPQDLYSRRQQTKNEWRNLATAAGALGIIGLLSHDSRLVFAGAAGALYSAYRYEQDRKSQNNLDRARAYYFSQPYFYREGVRYDRRTVTRDGQRYYQFVRG